MPYFLFPSTVAAAASGPNSSGFSNGGRSVGATGRWEDGALTHWLVQLVETLTPLKKLEDVD